MNFGWASRPRPDLAIANSRFTAGSVGAVFPGVPVVDWYLLVAEPPRLCASCHHLDSERMTRAHSGAAATAGRCTACHDPHVVKG